MIRSPITAGMIAGTPGYRRTTDAFSDRGLIDGYLTFERALAEVQSALGVIPADAATTIARACSVENLDLERLAASTAEVGYVIVPLVEQLSKSAGAHGEWVHFGTTSQDAMDTALVLKTRDSSAPILSDLRRAGTLLANMADRHRNTRMPGRSKLQHGAPMSFGFRVAVWLDQFGRCVDDLEAAVRDGCILQFGGAVGTLSSLGSHGPAVREALAKRLDLGEPEISWHVSRDRFARIVYSCASVLAAMAKIAGDITFQMSTEVGELREPYALGRGSSSTMPQKRNPVICEAIIEASRAVSALPMQMLQAMTQDQDRGIGYYYRETQCLGEAMAQLAGGAQLMNDLLDGLEVNVERMEANLGVTRGLIEAEAAMIALSETIGRVAAHHRIQEMCAEADRTGDSLTSILEQNGFSFDGTSRGELNTAEHHMIDAVIRRYHAPFRPTAHLRASSV